MNGLSREQKYAFQKFTRGENLFITGSGGTGKSYLIKHFIQYANSFNRHIDVCAMTGCAAILLNCNAKTLHSWSGIKLANGKSIDIINRVLKNKFATKSWKKVKILVVDEVSMLSVKIFEIIEKIARIIKNPNLPFGGIQVIFTGDFFQLPPVGTAGEPETEMFCFESPVWNTVFPQANIIELNTMFRQKDPLYIEILSQIRKGYLDEDKQQILRSRVNVDYDLEKHGGCALTKLFAVRSKTDYFNNMMFSKLKEKEYVFEVQSSKNAKLYLDTSNPIDVETLRICSQLGETEIDNETITMISNMPCPQVVRLKKGASVMCRINLDLDNEICNGSQGVIIDILEPKVGNVEQVGANGGVGVVGGGAIPVVRFFNGVVKQILPYYWQSENIPTIAVGQIPLCLSWALTIHKMQGASLSAAEMDIGHSIFEYGQTYVALSRIRSLEGLYLSDFQPQKIKANPKVQAFYDSILPLQITDISTDIPSTDVLLLDKKTEDELSKLSVNNFQKYAYSAASANIKVVKL
jgi:ATP-dependent DNA helicase PIF1